MWGLALVNPVFSQALESSLGVSFDNYSLRDGLSNSRVRSFLKDQRGFIWIGTATGLNRFDAYGFKVYRQQFKGENQLLHNSVLALLEDSSGNFWVGTKKGLQFLDRNTDRFFSLDAFPGSSTGEILNMIEDSRGRLWVASAKGLHRITPPGVPFTVDKGAEPRGLDQLAVTSFGALADPGGLSSNRVWCLEEGPGGRLWIGTNAGLRCYSLPEERFIPLIFPPLLNELETEVIHDLEVDHQGNLWAGAETGLFYLAAEGRSGKTYRQGPQALPNAFVTELEFDRRGNLWIGTSGGGIAVLRLSTGHFSHYAHHPLENDALPSNQVEALLIDRTGAVWIGTHDGISYYHPATKPFHFYASNGQEGSIPRGTVQGLLAGRDGRVWAGIDGAGLGRLEAGQWTHYPKERLPGLLANDVTAVLEDRRGQIWVGTWTGGLGRTDTSGANLRPVTAPALEGKSIWALFEDTQGRIWIGTDDAGPVLYDPRTDTYRMLREPGRAEPGSWSLAFSEDVEGIVWVSSSNGLYRYDERTRAFEHIPVGGMEREEYIYALYPAADGKWWLGTQQGLWRFDPISGQVEQWTEEQGLPNNWVVSIAEDRGGSLWIGSARGLSKFEPGSGLFSNYFTRDGERSLEFSRAVAEAPDGRLYFGTTKGVLVFHPDSIQVYPEPPPVALTDFKLFNKSLPIRGSAGDTAEPPSPLVVDIDAMQTLELTYWQHSFSFAFTALNYLEPARNTFRYQLEGYEDHWVETPADERYAYYTNIPPGRYRFKVMAANNDGVWNEVPAGVAVWIHPPWWRSWWAYLLYAVTLSALAGGVLYFLKKRWELNLQLVQEQREAERLKELDHFKSRLYTNLTHEFRTPLTVILGLTGEVVNSSPKFREQAARLIERNGQKLLRLINQLLDLSKLEDHSFRLNQQQGDVIAYLRYVTESFHALANGRNLSLQFHTAIQELVMDFDPEQLQQVLTNLISNAIKFTPSGGDITVHLDAENAGRRKEETIFKQLIIQVKDTGIGITEAHLPHIFDRFYQVANQTARAGEGTGIGLAHTLELVKLMKGKIAVASRPGQGTVFTVSLPVHRSAPALPAVEGAIPQPLAPPPSASAPSPLGQSVEVLGRMTGRLPQLLIIEDNPDVVFYLKSCLEGKYDLDVAFNGQVGIEKALENIPDLIISDVMMPEKDGYEVCNVLKNDVRTCHIPLILLTARADEPSKVHGLRQGADAYLAKPFNKEELLVRLEKLIELRKRLQERYAGFRISQFMDLPDGRHPDHGLDDAFVKQVVRIVGDNFSDEDFGLPQLCQVLGLSRSQLFRKMKALMNISPSEFIRIFRLQEAKRMLETGEWNVSEVAYRVGYKQLSHFSRNFQDYFGHPPSATNK